MKKRTTTMILLLALFAGFGLWGALSGGASAEAAQAEMSATPSLHLASASAGAPVVTVYKNPTCACCEGWADHLRESGFRVEMKEGADLMQVKQQLGVTMDLASCHTAEVDGYVLEGHVPADVIRKLLTERLQIRGLAVPGMPPGVPGMPEAGPGRALYEIVALQQDGGTHVYAER
jgi:hypothetical protein